MKWLIQDRLAVSWAKKRRGQARIWYSRIRARRPQRQYHVISLKRCVGARAGSFWVLIIGPLAIRFGLRIAGARHWRKG